MAIFSCQAAGDFTFRKPGFMNHFVKVRLPPFKKFFFFFFQWKHFENDEKIFFYFRLKRSFSSYNIYVFALTCLDI